MARAGRPKIAFADKLGIISQLMPTQLPERIDAIRWIEQRHSIAGIYPLKKFPRLSPQLMDDAGHAEFALEFGKQGVVAAITGQVQAVLPVTCQCCLNALALAVEVDIRLGLVAGLGEADRLPDAFEPLLSDSGWVSLVDLLEDELLLAIPIIPRHEQCSAPDIACEQTN